MPHPDISILQRLADGLLAEEDAAMVRAHLAECPACRKQAEHERLIVEALRELPLERPSASFDRTVLDAVLPVRAARTREASSMRRYAGLLVLCALTLVVVLLSPVQNDSAGASWMQPVKEWIVSGTQRISETLGAVARQIPSPSHIHASSSKDVIEVFSLALLALGAFAALDHFLSPRLRRDR